MCPSRAAFAITLGPTNPWLINITKETLVFRRAGLSPALRLLVPTFLLRNAPAWVTPLPSQLGPLESGRYEYSPTTPSTRMPRKSSVSVLHLAPIIFGAESLNE